MEAVIVIVFGEAQENPGAVRLGGGREAEEGCEQGPGHQPRTCEVSWVQSLLSCALVTCVLEVDVYSGALGDGLVFGMHCLPWDQAAAVSRLGLAPLSVGAALCHRPPAPRVSSSTSGPPVLGYCGQPVPGCSPAPQHANRLPPAITSAAGVLSGSLWCVLKWGPCPSRPVPRVPAAAALRTVPVVSAAVSSYHLPGPQEEGAACGSPWVGCAWGGRPPSVHRCVCGGGWLTKAGPR